MEKWNKPVISKFSESDLQRLKEIANRKGLPMTTYVRTVVLEALEKEQTNSTR